MILTIISILWLLTFILGVLGYLEKIRGTRWKARTLFIMLAVFTLASLGQGSFTYYNYYVSKEKDNQLKALLKSDQEKDQKLKNLIENELILKDLKIQLTYEFYVKNKIENKPAFSIDPTVFYAYLASSTSQKSLDSKQKIVFNSGPKKDYVYPNQNTVRVILNLETSEKILDKKIDYLSQFKVLVIPYKAIIDSLSYLNNSVLLKDSTVKVVILINGKIYEHYENKISFPFNSQTIFVSVPNGIFNDIQNKYLKLISNTY